MSILKLLFALNPKNLKLMKAEKMTPDMANQIDSFLGKIGAVVNIGKYKLTPKQAKFWVDQKKELDAINGYKNYLSQHFACIVEVFAAESDSINDPLKKASKAQPMKPALFMDF